MIPITQDPRDLLLLLACMQGRTQRRGARWTACGLEMVCRLGNEGLIDIDQGHGIPAAYLQELTQCGLVEPAAVLPTRGDVPRVTSAGLRRLAVGAPIALRLLDVLESERNDNGGQAAAHEGTTNATEDRHGPDGPSGDGA